MSENLMFSDKLWWSQQDSEGHVLWYIENAFTLDCGNQEGSDVRGVE